MADLVILLILGHFAVGLGSWAWSGGVKEKNWGEVPLVLMLGYFCLYVMYKNKRFDK